MRCHDCDAVGVERVALAVCTECGAGLCSAHAHELTTEVQALTLGNPTVRTVRRLRCGACAYSPVRQP
ncbi:MULTISPECIES: DUF2180 family protein [Microbacterium]|uniref:DUF2180 family protein n=1 Tax=Microbacterium TaxID=33882 RepID=UPI003B006AC0